ncbi:glycosyl hydrolase family cellulase (macronuclear) [Tetrahymena thermophila SB210]|uniref:Glycosyl hydrolase family cellulase n=1 Tax=Tetrahymena thermophila (strain SB210) TaxID=312017 RepID=I7M839_TETTS|nr:glycosyl hydrolase family cellulase [Tetrahymena thermophila SB210]EAR97108.2 glycosyl hydrolase family cellulase [Tetrahymena thermophila SB210]|eukprot:XP_001017353.2 glycosyl hydrolase family cellulase [Tetrahymena thermophila SB210]
MRVQMKLVLLISLTICLSYCELNVKVDPKTTLFVDQFNRTRVYHGLNVVYKVFPFYPPNNTFDPLNSFVEKDARDLRNWGFNSIRLFMAWEAFEPVRQQYNYTYLGELQKIVELCQQYNISVFLDAHQDVYNRFFCGEGMPDWTIMDNTNKTFPYPLPKNFLRRDDQGYPLIEDCLKVGFSTYYLTKDGSQQGENLFLNYQGLADDFANMWGEVAKYFSKLTHLTNFLGYEIINEPFGVSPWNHFLDWIWPGRGNNKYMLPFYQKVADKIWANHPDSMVFYEPTVVDYLSGGFSHNLGHPEKEVLSYHVYCMAVNPVGDPFSRILCDILDSIFIGGKEKNVQKIHVGGFLTEFGALSNSTKSAEELDYLLDKADNHLRSWAYWQYKGYADFTTAAGPGSEGFYTEDGQLQSNKVKHLSRPYAQAICGEVQKSKFNSNKVTYELIYVSGTCSEQTEIYLSTEYWFTNLKFEKKENIKEIIPNAQLPGYFTIIASEPNKKVHLIVKNN